MNQFYRILVLLILVNGCSNNNDRLYNIACGYEEAGKYEKAIKYLTRAIKKAPDDIECYNNRAWDYYEIGNVKNAYMDFEKILEIDTDNSAALYGIGYLLYKQQQYEKAFEMLNRAYLELNPNGIRIIHYNNSFLGIRAPLEADLDKVIYFKNLVEKELQNKP